MKRKGTSVFWCGVCGEDLGPDHKCKDTVCRAINAANTRAQNAEDAGEPWEPFGGKCEGERLADGFAMIGAAEAVG